MTPVLYKPSFLPVTEIYNINTYRVAVSIVTWFIRYGVQFAQHKLFIKSSITQLVSCPLKQVIMPTNINIWFHLRCGPRSSTCSNRLLLSNEEKY